MIHMQQDLNDDIMKKITFLIGDEKAIADIVNVASKKPFSDDVLEFLNKVSVILMKDSRSRQFPEVVTFAFWIRKTSTTKMKERFESAQFRLGKGVAFHIAPSNVPVNFAYSLVAGLLTGNANIVRVPSKDFPQVEIIADAFNYVLSEEPEMNPYIVLVKYGHDRDINNMFSSVCNERIVWGGDQTIAELRKSPLKPRTGEVTFADRYSLAVINADTYLATENKQRIAEDFYNDTYFSDQNACTSPRMVVWNGERIKEAKDLFWNNLHKLVISKYHFQDIMAINKLTSAYLTAVAEEDVKIIPEADNLIVRVEVPYPDDKIMELKDNSGFFFETEVKEAVELKTICDNKACQTIGYIGSKDWFQPLLESGIKGIDRIVPIGHTMDFDLVWDGYDLTSELTRIVGV